MRPRRRAAATPFMSGFECSTLPQLSMDAVQGVLGKECYAKAVLREGGFLVVTTPYHGYLKNLALSITNKWDFHHTPLLHGGHIKFWSRPTLTKLLCEKGFNVIGFYGRGKLPFLWKSFILVAQRAD